MLKKIFLPFTFFLFSSFLIISFFPNNALFDLSSKIQSAHFAPGVNLNLFEKLALSIYLSVDKILFFVDKHIPLFPSVLRQHLWDISVISLLLVTPLVLLLTTLISRAKTIGILFFILFFIFLIPFDKIISNISDRFVVTQKFDLYFPWSKKFVWIQSDNPNNNYVVYRYSWSQKSKETKDSIINVSCLGHYKLLVNGERVYHGPTFANLPNVYFDQIDISPSIKKGINNIEIICVYVKGVSHEYPIYQGNAILVGGKINDGLFSHNLADSRLWTFSVMKTVKGIDRIFDSGYKEAYDLTQSDKNFKISQNAKLDFKILPRPLKTLSYKQIQIKEIRSGVYSLGAFSTGYLVINSNQERQCRIKTNFGVTLDSNNFPITYVRQEDEFNLPKGEIRYEQISRRSGEYVGISGDCNVDSVKISFFQVYNNFDIDTKINFNDELDQKIFNLSLNSLRNDVQDHIEDSPDRERVTYLGDSVQVSKCLLSLGKNQDIVKQTIVQFASGQNSDGSFPSLAPSGLKQLIPSYSLQWPELLFLYLNKTDDRKFAKEMWPNLQKVIAWAENNESKEGFFYNKHKNRDWWNFFDWTPTSQALEFQTINQIWYIRALSVTSQVARIIGKDGSSHDEKADKLKNNLLRYAYDNEKKLFYDSFDKNNRDGISMITNALAGSFGLFPNKKENDSAINYFSDNYFTDTPYSQSWVVDWLLNSNKKELAKEVIEAYWGSMVSDGATSVYEKYKPNIYSPDPSIDSFSHAWGCGPVYQYKEILNL